MNIEAVSNHTAASAAAAFEYASPAGLPKAGASKAGVTTPADIKKAAAQFEAIIMRQLLAPSIEPIMSGGMGGTGSTGGGIYGHMLTEVLADSLSKAGGIGLGSMLEKQFAGAHPAAPTAAPLSSKSLFNPSTSTSSL